MTKTTVPLNLIEETTLAALVKYGAKDWIAAEVAKAVRKAEATGNLICGLYYLESYCNQLTSGRVKGEVEPEVSKPKPASVKVDAKLGFAQSAFAKGLPEAIKTAKEMGTASLAICHAHTCTSLGFFTEQIAENGLVAIGFTNASAVVSPPGGNKALLGTNPIAMAIPAKNGGIEFQFDQSTSAVALGKITMAKEAGDEIPLGWAVDENGQPTSDPVKALAGSLVSTGDYKGYGFGLMAEVLASAMTGSVNSLDVKAIKATDGKPHNLGQFYLLLDPQTFAGDAFYQRIKRLADAVDEQPNARLPGSKRILPNEVEISSDLWEKIQKLAS